MVEILVDILDPDRNVDVLRSKSPFRPALFHSVASELWIRCMVRVFKHEAACRFA